MDRRKLRALSLVSAAAVLSGLLVGCARRDRAAGGPGAEKTIRQIGSTTVLPLAEKWREAFNRANPDVDIAVSGGGSGTGIKALIAGTAEIANSSRAITPTEVEEANSAGVDPVEHVVAYDGIALIVHPSNPLDDISVEQLSDIFAGRITDWQAVGLPGRGQIQAIGRDSASGTYEAFKDLVVTLQGKDKSRDYGDTVLKQGSNQAVLTLVANTRSAVGYVGLGYLNSTVKALRVVPIGGGQGIAPTVKNVMSDTYPISRALYCYTNGEPTGPLKEYLDWIEGPEGQAIVEQLDFVPIK